MLLIVALALMAGGLLLGGLDLVVGGGTAPVENQQPFGPNGQQGQQGPGGGFRPGQPGVGSEAEPGEAGRKRIPLPATSPKPTPKAVPTP
jgi:hypothetical protein